MLVAEQQADRTVDGQLVEHVRGVDARASHAHSSGPALGQEHVEILVVAGLDPGVGPRRGLGVRRIRSLAAITWTDQAPIASALRTTAAALWGS